MNLFKGMLYTQGYLLDPQYADDQPRYGDADHRRYGNAHHGDSAKTDHAQPRKAAGTAPAQACTDGACG